MSDKESGKDFFVNQTDIDPETDKKTQISLARYELIYSLFGQALGLVCIISGVFLFVDGVSGSASWSANFFGTETTLTNAAPGAILFLVGFFLILFTRYKFSHKRSG